MRICGGLAGVVLYLAAGSAWAGELSAAEFQYIAERSPSVFDTFFHFQDLYEKRLPLLYFEADLVIGPSQDLNTDGGSVGADIAGGRLTGGTVPWTWNEHAGLRFGIDGYSTNLSPKGASIDDGWGYRKALLYGAAFDRKVGWNAAVGLYLSEQPVVRVVNGNAVFARNNKGERTELDPVGLFVHGTIPFLSLSTALLFDADGVRQVKAAGNIAETDLWESFGPYFAAFPQLDNYQLGLQSRRLRAWKAPITVSTDLSWRREPGQEVAFDHGLLSLDVTFFVDQPERTLNYRSKEFTSDFQLRLQVHGSYYNLRESSSDWGGGFLIDFLSIAVGRAELRAALGASYNYYEDLMMLPLPDVVTVKAIFSVGM